ncbi:hypothetical protein DL96DRAFT_1751794 [Flagelloscypha sp. PMI_526]|nr:hypothetical protein DL96DRAFT_1751794 [Flagelloscypha sp. PMI_526]
MSKLEPNRASFPDPPQSSEHDDNNHDSVSMPPNMKVSKTKRWHILCAGLHATLALLHLILVVIMIHQAERRVRIDVNRTTIWTTTTQILLQTFAIVYLAVVLLVSQKIFLARLLLTNQTLTASHDELASWLGLGSALNTLYKQRSTRSRFIPLFLITLYLAASATVKVTTAALFFYQPITITRFQDGALLSMYPDINYTSFIQMDTIDTPPRLQSILNQFLLVQDDPHIRNASFISAPLALVGIEGNTVYDIVPEVSNATSVMEVNTYTVDVTCNTFQENVNWKSTDGGTWPINFIVLGPPTMAKIIIHCDSLQMSVYNDTSRASVNQTHFQSGFCRSTVRQGKEMANVRTRGLVNPRLSFRVSGSLPAFGQGQLDPSSSLELLPMCYTTESNVTDKPIIINHQKLRIFPPAKFENSSLSSYPWPTTMIHNLENAIEDYIAGFLFVPHWRVLENSVERLQPSALAANQVQSQVPYEVTVLELQLSPVPVYVGFSASLIMLAIALWIVFTTPTIHHSALDSLGLLQLFWLAGYAGLEPELRPTEHKLRRAGQEIRVTLEEGGLGRLKFRTGFGSQDSFIGSFDTLKGLKIWGLFDRGGLLLRSSGKSCLGWMRDQDLRDA